MKILLVNPLSPVTFLGFQYCLPIVRKKIVSSPLALITVGACLPDHWEVRLLDLNAGQTYGDHLDWCDAVFTGGFRGPEVHEVVAKAKNQGKLTVVGGPSVFGAPEDYSDADIVFVGELEGRMDQLEEAMKNPNGFQILYPEEDYHPDMAISPTPRYDLLEVDLYTSINVQYSRGCPHHCEFCDVVEMFGHKPRVKTPDQFIKELNTIRDCGFTGHLFLADDNFIGNRSEVRTFLHRVIKWQEENNYLYELHTSLTVELATDEALLDDLVKAGFTVVFIGLESPSKAALKRAGKNHNLHDDLIASVKLITSKGLEVMGGFLVGFDEDDANIFEIQKGFIHDLPIPLAVASITMAIPGTRLWNRLEKEGRARSKDLTDQFCRPNYQPAMAERDLLVGYQDLIQVIYSPEEYYHRCKNYVDLMPKVPGGRRIEKGNLMLVLRLIYYIGLKSPRRWHFWKLITRCLVKAPHALPRALVQSVMGEHLIPYANDLILPIYDDLIAELDAEQYKTQSGKEGSRRSENPRLPLSGSL